MKSRPLSDLTANQRDILYLVFANEASNGQELKRELEKAHDREIPNPMIYNPIEKMIDDGLIIKVEIDGRSNAYGITHLGLRAIEEDLEWRVQQYEESVFS